MSPAHHLIGRGGPYAADARMTVATVGVHIVDILARPVEYIPEGQDTVLVEQIRLTAAGSAAGTAVDLVRLGAEVTAIGAIGDDELGRLPARRARPARRRHLRAGPPRRRADRGVDPADPAGRRAAELPRAGREPHRHPRRRGRGGLRAKAVHLGGVDVTFGSRTRLPRAARPGAGRRRRGHDGPAVEHAGPASAAKAFFRTSTTCCRTLEQALAMTGAADAGARPRRCSPRGRAAR